MQKQSTISIPKPVFVAHKREFKTFLDTRLYTIACIFWEHKTSAIDIAKKYKISTTRIYQLLGKAKYRIQENGYSV